MAKAAATPLGVKSNSVAVPHHRLSGENLGARSLAGVVRNGVGSTVGVVQKLSVLGLPGMTRPFASMAGKLFGVIVLATGFIAARRKWKSRADGVAAWLSLIGLASLTNAFGPADYIALPALWLLTYMAIRMSSSRVIMVILCIFWVFQFFMIGGMPIGSWFPMSVMDLLSLVGSVSLHAFYFVVLLGTTLRMESLDDPGEPTLAQQA